MSSKFSKRTFVVRDRHRFYTELKRKTERACQNQPEDDFASITDLFDEGLKTGIICAVKNEAVLKSIFHKSTSDLTFSQIVDIAAEFEEALRTAQQQISENVEEL
ncbi:hypothetical protein RF11_07526 [Thelohanellus kitauei]|uniref:Uncharacterized protein n=1 Tax=Thelohanellus kitauei TaxID=669202 RepID=A0A0C2MBC4_THEKT|nr:hypothetical protein RF11_07526 [Thelohanellus kitauei]